MISNLKNLKSAFNFRWFVPLKRSLKMVFKNDECCVCSRFDVESSKFDVCKLSQKCKVFKQLQLLQYWFDFEICSFYRLEMLSFVQFPIFMLSKHQVLGVRCCCLFKRLLISCIIASCHFLSNFILSNSNRIFQMFQYSINF